MKSVEVGFDAIWGMLSLPLTDELINCWAKLYQG